MDKKVLVIEDTHDGKVKFWDDADAVACRGSLTSEEFYMIYSPGKLLAEFEGDVTKTSDPKLEFKSVHVLILGGGKK